MDVDAKTLSKEVNLFRVPLAVRRCVTLPLNCAACSSTPLQGQRGLTAGRWGGCPEPSTSQDRGDETKRAQPFTGVVDA